MAEFDSSKMDNAANDAAVELETLRKNNSEGVQAVEEWVKKWASSAGYKRLGKIPAGRWE